MNRKMKQAVTKSEIAEVSLFASRDDIFQARDDALDMIERIDGPDRVAALTAFYIFWNTLANNYNVTKKEK